MTSSESVRGKLERRDDLGQVYREEAWLWQDCPQKQRGLLGRVWVPHLTAPCLCQHAEQGDVSVLALQSSQSLLLAELGSCNSLQMGSSW